jgi:hypothetical protein
MALRGRAVLSGLFILVFSSAALGAEGEAAQQSASFAAWLLVFSPLILFIVFMIVLARRSGVHKQGGYMEKASEHMDLNLQYMARMEQKTDRMIALLESIDRKLGEGEWEADRGSIS